VSLTLKNMATYFAELNQDKTVKRVIVADQEFINSGAVGNPENWVETTLDGSKGKNYAAIGHTYDKDRDAFISPKPFDSWTLDEATARWKAPIEKPKDGKEHRWEEPKVNWELRQ
jgi:hypothetical protein